MWWPVSHHFIDPIRKHMAAINAEKHVELASHFRGKLKKRSADVTLQFNVGLKYQPMCLRKGKGGWILPGVV